MSVSSLRQVFSPNFVSGLAKIGQASSSPAAALTNSNKSEALDVTLRTGAKSFAQGLQALNVAASYINLSRASNQKLLNIVDQLDVLVTKASKGSGGAQGVALAKLEFRSLSRDFEKALKESKIQGEDVLDSTDLTSVLVRAGLDPDKADSISSAFSGFETLSSSSSTATDGSTEPTTIRMPVDEFLSGLQQSAGAFDEAVDSGESPDTTSSFKKVREQLGKVRKTLRGNLKALDDTVEVIGKNMSLARATGLALLDLSNSITSSAKAEDVAAELQRRVRSSAGQALSQSENLNSILVAGATLTSSTFSKK